MTSRARHATATRPTEAPTQASKIQQRYSFLTKETDSVLAAYPSPITSSEWSIPSSVSALDRRKWMDRLGWVASVEQPFSLMSTRSRIFLSCQCKDETVSRATDQHEANSQLNHDYLRIGPYPKPSRLVLDGDADGREQLRMCRKPGVNCTYASKQFAQCAIS